MGNKPLYKIKKEMDEIYAKEDFGDADGERVGVLQVDFEEMDGWNAESNAAYSPIKITVLMQVFTTHTLKI